MPLVTAGNLMVLLAQTSQPSGPLPVTSARPQGDAAVVQRGDAFVIVAAPDAAPVVRQAPLPAPRNRVKLGHAVGIDAALLAIDRNRVAGGER